MLKKLIDGERLSKELFKNPPRELGILPFWFWNGELNYDEMEFQIKELHAKGIPGFFIHSRFGLKVPYLSEEWFKRVRFAADKARELGMQVWIYDEKNWPSGTVGWEIPRQYEELQQRYLEMVILDVYGPLFTYLEGTDSRYIDLEDSEPICAFAVSGDEFDNGEITEVIDLTPNLSFEKIIPWEAPAGYWKLLYFVERRAKWYIDALNPESTSKFIELTHEQYKKWVGQDFGELIPGFYTDEPAMHYFEIGQDNYIVPWSQKMFKLFREANGYDLKPWLPALYADMGEKTSKIRYDFWHTLSEQYAKAYYGQISEWCQENGLIHTGHLMFEEQLRLLTRAQGNIFRQLKEMHLIGVDHLYPKIGTEESPQSHVEIKVGSSAAHHYGSTRTLCESLGGTYWDCTMERMKWIADWEYVLGINLFNPHGFHYSIEGERKRDWPPSQFYHHPWWEKYDKFNEYITRNSYALSGGRHVAKVAIIYPMTSIWTNYQPQGSSRIMRLIEAEFYYFADLLLRLHFDYDFLDEAVLAEAEVKNGNIRIAGEEYSLVIMPPLTTVKRSTVDKLEDFFDQGGSIIGNALLPTELPSGTDQRTIEVFKKIFNIDPVALRRSLTDALAEDPRVLVNQISSGGRGIFLKGGGLARTKAGEILDEIIRSCITPDVEISDRNVFYLHRVKEGKDIYFVVNPTAEERWFTISLEGEGIPEVWSSETGEIRTLPVYHISDGRTSFPVHLHQFGSALYLLNRGAEQLHVYDTNTYVEKIENKVVTGYSAKPDGGYLKLQNGEKTWELKVEGESLPQPFVLNGRWKFSVNTDNVLLINEWKVKIDHDGSGVESGYAASQFDDNGWLTFRPGAWEMQLPFERDVRDFPVILWYRCRFEIKELPSTLCLLIDGMKGKTTIYLNGQEVTGIKERSQIDAEIKTVAIENLVTTGINTMAIRIEVDEKVAGILDPLKLVGKMSVQGEEDLWTITAPVQELTVGTWTTQGYPFFSGTGSYKKTFSLPESFTGKKTFLELECGDDVVEVEVNGKLAGTILWHPYRLDLTDLLVRGENSITISVTNTLINMLEGIKRPSGLLTEPRLVAYNKFSVQI